MSQDKDFLKRKEENKQKLMQRQLCITSGKQTDA